MKKEQDIERGVIASPKESPAMNHDRSKKRIWIHVFVIMVSCALAAGAGVAFFASQRANQLVTFQTQFDSSVVLLGNSITLGFEQKFAVSRLLSKMYQHGDKHGYGEVFGQHPPFFSLPGLQGYFPELATLGGHIRTMNWNPMVDASNTSLRSKWEEWAKKNIATQTYGLSNNQSLFATINSTAYKYGIYNKTNGHQKRAGNVITQGDPRFSSWLFPLWQESPLDSTTAPAVFLEPHSFLGSRLKTIDKILAVGSTGKGNALTDIVQLT